jgi:hypothetical protein
VAAEHISQGSLFSTDFLQESIARVADWQRLTDAEIDTLTADLRAIFSQFPTAKTPNESQTEGDLIWPILARLGWTAFLPQQNLSAKGREDVPDRLLFKDAATKAEANAFREEWKRYADAVMATVIDALSFELTTDGRKYINYRDLSVQQLGSIYERLLEHEVVCDGADIIIRPNVFARKGSGSYYTPGDLVGLIIRETVDPLAAARIETFSAKARELEADNQPEDHRLGILVGSDPAERLLELKICDPAMGSGHFLVSLVDYLSDQVITAMAEAQALVTFIDYVSPLIARIAAIRRTILRNAEERGWTIDQEQLDDRHIVRRMVLKCCIYGVDKNLMAVELAKVSLWLHTFTVGAPLSFLDHHLCCGDSLFGSWVRGGIDRASAFGAPLLLHAPMTRALRAASKMQIIEGLTDSEIAEAHRSKDVFDEVRDMTAPLDAFLSLIHAFAWLHLWDRADRAVLSAFFDGQFGDPVQVALGAAKIVNGRPQAARFAEIFARARELVTEERFLNWQVSFPGVWSDWEGEKLTGGFDAVIGNPPWGPDEAAAGRMVCGPQA